MVPLPAVITDTALVTRLAEYQDKAKGALAASTERALRADTAIFSAWCGDHGLEALPASPETVAAFIDAQAELKAPATVRRYVSSIARLHKAAGLDSPTTDEAVKLAIKRMSRANGTRQKQADALNRGHVDRMLAAAGDAPIALRDKALLAVAYDLLARRSELVALDVEDLTFAEDGTGTALIRWSKTDQAGEGAVGFIAHDTIEHVRRWLEAAGATDGPLFLSARRGRRLNDRDVPRIFKKMAKAAGLNIDPSGHSTRVGVAQDMTAAGFGTAEVMQAGRWKTPAMVARYSEQQRARRGASAKLAALQNR